MVVKGKQLTLKEYWQKLKDELKDMTPKQKLEHLWEYYKWVLGVFLGVILVICVVISSIISLNTELRLSGTLINVDVSPDGYVYLQDGYFARIGGQEGKEVVELRNMQFQNPYTTLDQTYALDVQESVIALISAGDLDYLLFDELALPFFMDPETVLDLRELFSQEELDAMGSAVIKLQMPDTGELLPMAIDIRDTVFFDEYMETDEAIYLAFAINTPRKEACLDFWCFIKGGSTQSLCTQLAGTVVDAPLTEAEKTALGQGFFESQGYVPGDHRVELTEQSFVQPEGAAEDGAAQQVVDHVHASLESGALDYILCDSAALEKVDKSQLLDLSLVLPEEALADLSLVCRGDVPVAVELSALGITESEAWLAFGAGTTRLDACKALWAHIHP